MAKVYKEFPGIPLGCHAQTVSSCSTMISWAQECRASCSKAIFQNEEAICCLSVLILWNILWLDEKMNELVITWVPEPLAVVRLLLTFPEQTPGFETPWVICREQPKNVCRGITKYLCFILKCVENHINAEAAKCTSDCSKIEVNLNLGDFFISSIEPHISPLCKGYGSFAGSSSCWFKIWNISKSVFLPFVT